MSTLLRRDPRTMFPDLVEWFEEPFLTLRPYLGQPIRIEDFVEGDHYMVRAELAGMDPEKDVEVTVDSGYLTIRAARHDKTEGKPGPSSAGRSRAVLLAARPSTPRAARTRFMRSTTPRGPRANWARTWSR